MRSPRRSRRASSPTSAPASSRSSVPALATSRAATTRECAVSHRISSGPIAPRKASRSTRARRAHRRDPLGARHRCRRHPQAARCRSDLTWKPRTYLFVPGNRPERFAKALASGADAVVLDLEDAVAAAVKGEARDAIAHWLRQAAEADRARIVVRINDAQSSDCADDLRLLRDAGIASVMLPKAESAAQVQAVREVVPDARVLALIESARGVASARDVAAASGSHTSGLRHARLRARPRSRRRRNLNLTSVFHKESTCPPPSSTPPSSRASSPATRCATCGPTRTVRRSTSTSKRHSPRCRAASA